MRTPHSLPLSTRTLTIGIAAGLVMMAGCESSSRSLVGPSATKCALSIPASPPPLDAAGGSGSLPVTAARECTWSATTPTSWISIADGTGQGDGVIRFTVAANPSPSERQGELIVGEERTGIVQEGACLFAVTPTTYGLGADGGVFPVTVRTDDRCTWTAGADAEWVEVEGPAGSSGSATVRVRVDANTQGPRRATVRIAGREVAIDQAGYSADCQTAIAPTDASVSADGGALFVAVTATGGCQWTATSQNAWIAVTRGPTGNGPGSVALAVAPNPGEARMGTVVVAGRTFTVMQAGSTAAPPPPPPTCSYSLDPPARSLGADGGNVAVDVAAGDGCAWSAASQEAWITVTSGGSGSGNGTVGLAVAVNAGAERTGTVTIGGQVFTVSQAAATPEPCSYSLSSTGQSMPATGGSTSVDVSARGGCDWSAASQAAWITVTAGATGSGNGTVQLSVADNTGDERIGSVTIAGQAFTVTQAAAAAPVCSYTLNPAAHTVPLIPLGSFTFTMETQAGCAWTAVSGNAWITIASGGSGTGSGVVTYNAGIALLSRTGSITVAGQTHTVHQGGLLLTPEGR